MKNSCTTFTNIHIISAIKDGRVTVDGESNSITHTFATGILLNHYPVTIGPFIQRTGDIISIVSTRDIYPGSSQELLPLILISSGSADHCLMYRGKSSLAEIHIIY